MNSPRNDLFNKLTFHALFVALVTFSMVSFADAQKEPTPEAVGYTLNQCANGGRGGPKIQCAGNQWQNGNLGINNSQYVEGDSTPYRSHVTGLTIGQTYIVTIEWDTTKGGLHTIDYITSFDRTELDADPCSGIAGCSLATRSDFPIPLDPVFASECPTCTQEPGDISIFGGEILSLSSYTLTGTYAGDSSTQITVTYRADATSVVLAWGGHIGSRLDWGVGNSAVNVPGSPYHMRLKDVGGNRDRSMSANAIIFPAIVTIFKEVSINVIGQPPITTSSQQFAFSSTNFGEPSAFVLVDNVEDNNNPPANRTDFETRHITNFGAANTITITEAVVPGWTLNDLECDIQPGGLDPVGSYTTSLVNRQATITVLEANIATCVFRNGFANPTSAPASISGRVTTPDGMGMRGISVRAFNVNAGTYHTVTTNTFGSYTIAGLNTTDTYILTAFTNRKVEFFNNDRVITLNEDLFGVDFQATSW